MSRLHAAFWLLAQCTIGLSVLVLVGGEMSEIHTVWQRQETEYAAVTNEYTQHRCRDTQMTTTNRLIMAECHRLGLILETTPLMRTRTLVLHRWESAVRALAASLAQLALQVATNYVYRLIFLATSLVLASYVYQYYCIVWRSAADGNAYRNEYDRLRAEATESYIDKRRQESAYNPIYSAKHRRRIARPLEGYSAWWCKSP
jgi:hypothetical protein